MLLQFGTSSGGPGSAELAADRTVDQTANRAGARTEPASIAGAIPVADISKGELVEPTTTTTTVAPTTTTPPTTLPPTTAAPATTKAPAPARTATTQASRAAVQNVAAPPPPPPPAPARETAPSGAIADDVWKRLAMCESGVRNDGGAPYYGYFQFSPQTWRSVGGTGLPNDHSYEVQKQFAIKLQARSGWGQWPACTRKMGLR